MATEPRRATVEDLPFVLELFDRRIAWLVARGIPGQWGAEPVSGKPSFVGRVRGWLEAGDGWIVEGQGFLAVSDEAPPYAAEGWTPGSAFLSALITAPEARRGLGRELIRGAEARLRGRPRFRLDCWADGTFLEGYYGSMGFVRVGEFTVGGFRGAVMEKRLGPRAGSSHVA